MKKIIFSIIIVVSIILLLLSNTSYAENDGTVSDTDKLNARVLSRLTYTADEPLKITSREELKEYLAEGETYEIWFDRNYPDTFFEDKFVYLRHIERTNDMASYEVTDVQETDNSLKLEVTRVALGNGDMSADYCLLVDADKSLLDKDLDVSFKRCLYTTEYFDGMPQSSDTQDYIIIDTLEDLQNSWNSAEALAKYGNTDFTKKSLIIVSWDEPQQVRATAVTDVTLADSGSKITLSRCFPDGELFPDVITPYSAVICVPKAFVKNEPLVIFKQYDEQNANDISIKSISANNLMGYEVVVGVENLSEKAMLIVVTYDDDNIHDITTQKINSDGEHRIVTYNTHHGADKISVFMWDSISGMRPLGAVKDYPAWTM